MVIGRFHGLAGDGTAAAEATAPVRQWSGSCPGRGEKGNGAGARANAESITAAMEQARDRLPLPARQPVMRH
jgi:hypothetical protein